MRKGTRQRRRAFVPVPAIALREEAANRLASFNRNGHPPSSATREVDPVRLLHELEVHKFELETQNEELRAAQLHAEESLARYTELFDFAPMGYAVLGRGAIIRELNHRGARLLGRERAKIVGRAFVEFVADEDVLGFHAFMGQTFATDAKQTCELQLQVGDRAVYVHLTSVRLARSDTSVLLAFEDITERRHRAELLAQSEQALRDADRRKDEFLAMLSHELRNPLAPIRTGLFVLARAEPESAEARDMHAIIDRQVTHLTRLINDLLDITRIRRGKVQLQRETVDLTELVRHTFEDHRRSFAIRGIALECHTPGDPVHVQADAARVVQIMSNLLGNAEKFTQRGGRVALTLVRENAAAVLRVSDDGAGIAPTELDHVFEPFSQAAQTIDGTRGGLGLGLSMVKGLVLLHGGTVHIDSRGLGHGTQVTVSLPLSESPSQIARMAKPAGQRRLRVLIIDDQVDAADSLCGALGFFGHDVGVAYDGIEGLERVRRDRPDVVICDIGLPRMDGYHVARAIREDASLQHTFLIALSGYARPEDLERADRAGFDRHLAKPADIDAISELFAEARLPRESTAPLRA